MAYLGQLVTIEGIEDAVTPVDEAANPIESAEKVNVSGTCGRIVAASESGKYMVHLSSDVFVNIPEGNVRPYSPQPYKDGGFDLMWPSSQEEIPLTGYQVSTILGQQGWCLVECIAGKALKEEAWQQAQTLPGFFSPKPELLPDYLGKGGSGKVTYLEVPEPGADELTDGSPIASPDVLLKVDAELDDICRAMAETTPDLMGFTTAGRKTSLVWMPFENRDETMRLRGEPLTEDDVEDGVIQNHLSFVRHRKVGFLRMVDNEGGELVVIPREDVIDAKPAKIPLSPNKLFIYRADLITFQYKPRPMTKSLVLKTWLLEEPPPITLHSIVGGLDKNSDLIGIKGESIPAPVGLRMHVMALAGRQAGGCTSAEACWSKYSIGCDGFVPIGISRWDTSLYHTGIGEEPIPGKSYVNHSSLMEDTLTFDFDNAFFGVRDEDVFFLSPSQRMSLEEGYTCLHRHGYTLKSVKGQPIPVFVGDTGSDFTALNNIANPEKVADGTNFGSDGIECWLGASQGMTASRLSYTLSLTAGCCQVDTACSASLVAVHIAAVKLRQPEKATQGRVSVGQKNMTEALPMGVSVQLGPGSFIGLCAGTMLSKDGRCFTFDDHANGYARGEGCVTLLMKVSDSSLDDAKQIGCLLGIASNQDGRSANLTAPNGPAQQACIRSSMLEAGRVPKEICVAECHGTGTALGDPIEVGALRGAMEPRTNPLITGSSKSHIGHLEANAGITGITKCVMMMASSCCPPNVHLYTLNHNLDMDGFPIYFANEICDSGVEAGVSGVSSFGFGGTNARADCWSRARKGARKTGEHHINPNSIKHLQVMCPVTLEPIDYLTGEPISSVLLNGKEKRCDVIRDVLAPYDISRHVYNGGFRYRLVEPLDAYEEDLPEATNVKICGTWTGYQKYETMERQGNCIYSTTIVLGDTRCEKFSLSLNGNPSQMIYPAINNSSELISVRGPDANGQGPNDTHPRNWIIDGRDLEVPIGTVYRIYFKWGQLHKQVWWEEVSAELAPTTPPYQHRYCVMGSFSAWLPSDMEACKDEPNAWEFTVRIGTAKWEEFCFCRDGDIEQAIYPAREKTQRMGTPIQGPDEYRRGRSWVIQGTACDLVKLKIKSGEGHMSVHVEREAAETKVWESLEGWDRHHYYLLGSWTNWALTPMIMDPERPGTYRTRVKFVGRQFTSNHTFRISLDGTDLVYRPECEKGTDATVYGKYIVCGPEKHFSGDMRWVLAQPANVDVTYEVVFTPASLDKRQIVTWSYLESSIREVPLSLEE